VLLAASMGRHARGAGPILVTLVVAGWTSPAASQDLSDVPTPADAQATSTESSFKGASWYGYQTFAPDALALTVLLAAGDQRDSAAAGWTMVGLYLLGAPTVHALHRSPGAVAGSLALRVLMPLLGAGLGGAIPCHQRTDSDEGCDLGGTIIGFEVGLGVAVILDSALLAWDRAPAATSAPARPRAAATPAQSLSLSPAPLRGGAGLMLAGLF
jgi:hypothetical protein